MLLQLILALSSGKMLMRSGDAAPHVVMQTPLGAKQGSNHQANHPDMAAFVFGKSGMDSTTHQNTF